MALSALSDFMHSSVAVDMCLTMSHGVFFRLVLKLSYSFTTFWGSGWAAGNNLLLRIRQFYFQVETKNLIKIVHILLASYINSHIDVLFHMLAPPKISNK